MRSIMNVYLDYNATSKLRPEAITGMEKVMRLCGNSSSVHRFGRLSRRAVEESREALADSVNASHDEVVFTSGGTESNNFALLGSRRKIIASSIEHDSVLQHVDEYAKIRVNSDGVIDLFHLEELLKNEESSVVVSVMVANNETGVIQPIEKVLELCRRYDAWLHCDGVQALGKIPISFSSLGVDMMSLSAHKLGGPQGIGALVIRDGVSLSPISVGGGQERGQRAGTENIIGIGGFGAVCETIGSSLEVSESLLKMRDNIEKRFVEIAPDIAIYGKESPRLANTSCIGLPGIKNEVQVMALDLSGVAVSSGSACSSGKIKPSHVLVAMGANSQSAECAIRISLGWDTSTSDCESLIKSWETLARSRVEHAFHQPTVA
tara:strand:+ start:9954 stop:11087 length:1134 start_codon:yes stop_codon:yes gene_type:complete